MAQSVLLLSNFLFLVSNKFLLAHVEPKQTKELWFGHVSPGLTFCQKAASLKLVQLLNSLLQRQVIGSLNSSLVNLQLDFANVYGEL